MTQEAFDSPTALKEAVHAHWTAEPCGTRGVREGDRRAYFATLEADRYRLEPFIPKFARFSESKGLRVLEIGVGPGNDFIQWLRNGAVATGVDLTEAGIALTRERAELEGFKPDLQLADAENLPFADATFDVVYSYGVLHHTPDTDKAIAEVARVLKPGGQVRLMLYHYPSWTSMLLWGVHCVAKGKPWLGPRWATYHFLESPGTKSYTLEELDKLLAAFTNRHYEIVFLGGDLLSFRPAAKYQSPLHQLAWRVYPRGLVRRFGKRWGHGTLIDAVRA